MSFDLLVFDQAIAPRNLAGFLQWMDDPMNEPLFNDAAILTPALFVWYGEMIRLFPPLNGPDAMAEDEMNIDNPLLTDYALAKHLIYLCFRWSEAEDALDTSKRLAQKHCVGLYNISDDKTGLIFSNPVSHN